MRRKSCSALAGGLGEANTGGPQMNIIGKQGGNRFAGSFFITGTGDKFQGTNLTPALQAQGSDDAAISVEGVGYQPRVWRPDHQRQTVVLRHVPLPVERPERRQHVGQPERRRQHEVDVSPRRRQERPAAASADRRRPVEERLAAVDLAGDAEKQVQLLVGPTSRSASTASRAAPVPGKTFSGTIASPEALQQRRESPELA